MDSLLNESVHAMVVDRINKLSLHSERQWGKMEVAQMLAHCCEAFKVPLSEQPLKITFLGRVVGWAFKSKLYDDSPWKQGLPTAPNFIIKDKRVFDAEKERLMDFVRQFHRNNEQRIGNYPHPIFGTFTKEQWGQAMYKHLDHHLRQFGV